MAELNLIGTLPNELIQHIYQCVVDTSSWEEARTTFYACQLLCKSWSRLAQIALYRDVRLPLHKIESFAKALADSSTTTQLGDLVDSVDFYSDGSYYNCSSDVIFPFPDTDEMLHGQLIDTVLKYTPHIKSVGSSLSSEFEKILRNRLLQTNEPLAHLQKFTLLDEPNAAQKDPYKQLSLKLKKTLTVLQLVPNPQAVGNNFTTLKENLKEFVSLEELQLWGGYVESPIITEVDDLINNCPTTTHSLTLRKCRFLDGHNYPEDIKVNSCITGLQFQYSTLSARSLGYFAKKLPGLKNLTVTMAYDFEQEEWWNQMIELCQPLQQYNININNFEDGQPLHQITGCAAMMTKTFAHQKKNISTEFVMNLGYSLPLKRYSTIQMKQGDSSVCIYGNKVTEQNAIIFDEIFRDIQSSSPQTITISGVDCQTAFARLTVDNATSKTEVRDSFSPFYKNWAIYNGVISLIKDKVASVIHLGEVVFSGPEEGCDNITQDVLSNSTSVSEFKFTNCLFGSNVLSKMLTRLPKIDRLVLQKCTFKSDSLYQLDIDLPETKLGHLELNLNQVACSGLFDMYASVEIVLRIGTVETIIYREIGDKDLTEFSFSINCNDFGDESCSVNPTPKYCISINCKELQSLVFSAKKSNQ